MRHCSLSSRRPWWLRSSPSPFPRTTIITADRRQQHHLSNIRCRTVASLGSAPGPSLFIRRYGSFYASSSLPWNGAYLRESRRDEDRITFIPTLTRGTSLLQWNLPSQQLSTISTDRRDYNSSLEGMVSVTYERRCSLPGRDMRGFWSDFSTLLQRDRKGMKRTRGKQLRDQIDSIWSHTLDHIKAYNTRDMAETTFAIAKIVEMIDKYVDDGGRLREGTMKHILHGIFIGENSSNKELIFNRIAAASVPVLQDFDSRSLSVFVDAFSLAKHVPEFLGDRDMFFDALAVASMSQLRNFNFQELSILLRAFANAGVYNHDLFEEAGDYLIERQLFKPRSIKGVVWAYSISNILRAYATFDETHPALFRAIADHVVERCHVVEHNRLKAFQPQALSNMLWAFSMTKESHQKLFQKVGDHIVESRLRRFTPQKLLSNIVCSYATANETHPKLFQRIGDYVSAFKVLESFKPHAVANIAWAFASCNESHPRLFERVADHLVSSGALKELDPQALSNVAWAYAMADVYAPSLFNQEFVDACLSKQDDFSVKSLRQLHQWNLWQQELKSDIQLPPLLEKNCYEAFTSA